MLEHALLGEHAIRFARPQGMSPRALVQAVRAWPGVIDVVVAREDVAAYFAGEPHIPVDPFAGVDGGEATAVREHVLAAVYDGEDLAAVAHATGVSVADIARRHAAASYTVDAIGFQPGFAYLVGLDPALAIPRRSTPRARVPAGAIGIAVDATCVYPFDSPGGWHLIGRVVGATMFGEHGALVQLGDRVRFEPC